MAPVLHKNVYGDLPILTLAFIEPTNKPQEACLTLSEITGFVGGLITKVSLLKHLLESSARTIYVFGEIFKRFDKVLPSFHENLNGLFPETILLEIEPKLFLHNG